MKKASVADQPRHHEAGHVRRGGGGGRRSRPCRGPRHPPRPRPLQRRRCARRPPAPAPPRSCRRCSTTRCTCAPTLGHQPRAFRRGIRRPPPRRPGDRGAAAAARPGGSVTACHSRRSTSTSQSIDVVDPALDRWRRVADDLALELLLHAACSAGPRRGRCAASRRRTACPRCSISSSSLSISAMPQRDAARACRGRTAPAPAPRRPACATSSGEQVEPALRAREVFGRRGGRATPRGLSSLSRKRPGVVQRLGDVAFERLRSRWPPRAPARPAWLAGPRGRSPRSTSGRARAGARPARRRTPVTSPALVLARQGCRPC